MPVSDTVTTSTFEQPSDSTSHTDVFPLCKTLCSLYVTTCPRAAELSGSGSMC